jgi:hypothetical protein
MNIPLLIIALLLPWLGGYWWLGILARRYSRSPFSLCSQMGYGLFLGYSGLQGIVLGYDSLTGGVAFLPIIAAITLITGLGGWLYVQSPRHFSAIGGKVDRITNSRAEAVLLWLFVAWTLLHLIFVAIEILYRPVFPWDAWLSWMYRAKAWYFSSEILLMDNPSTWVSGTGTATYNVAGHSYPTFSPILALWSAMALGEWSETLVNLPVLFCGVALALAMFGQARDQGLPTWASALCAYLLLSIPLVGAHLALAGQADIWMAGFTGLGFIALLLGLLQRSAFQLTLALAMLALGLAVKMEGRVWLLCAVLTAAVVARPRFIIGLLAAAAILVLLGWIAGVTYIDLPLLGELGIKDGLLYLPFYGSYQVQQFELLDDYQKHFFESGTWHIFWTVVVLSAGLVIAKSSGRLRLTLLSFYAVLFAVHMVIFKFTAIGQWAEDGTVINRLPLHFAPALLFSVALIVGNWQVAGNLKASSRALWIPALSLVVTVVGSICFLSWANPANDADTVQFSASQLKIRAGGGQIRNGVGLISRYDNNVAIVSANLIRLNASNLPMIKIETSGDNQKHRQFFWRLAQHPNEPSSVSIPEPGIHYLDLSRHPDWNGLLTEIGLIFYNDDNKPIRFHSLSLSPFSLNAQLAKLANDWQVANTWSQRSVHSLPVGATNTSLPLPVLMASWVLVSFFIVLMLRRKYAMAILPSVMLCAVLAWIILDVRWTANRFAQASITARDYSLAHSEYLVFSDDKQTFDAIARAKASIQSPEQRLLIMAEHKAMRFNMLRAKYHALPTPAFVHEGDLANQPPGIAEYVLVLRKLYYAPDQSPASSKSWAEQIEKRLGLPSKVLWDDADAFLIKVSPNDPTVDQ